jgi:Dolichyl-phosphate-mannose-protein mannosyltransferase
MIENPFTQTDDWTGTMAVLPLLFFCCCILGYLPKQKIMEAVLRSAVTTGVLVVVITELLSWFNILAFDFLALAWILCVVAAGALVFRRCRDVEMRTITQNISPYPLCHIPIAIILIITLLIALFAPPNTYDSMTYHMSRVSQWVHHANVKHYPTNITRQLYANPWAEFLILHLQILSMGSDRLANLVQWGSFAGSMIAVGMITGRLGFNRNVQYLAALFVATTPMAILQSTSTQNDLVCAFWVSCTVYFLLVTILAESEQGEGAFFFASLSCALAFLTKSTALIFISPFFAWFLLHRLRIKSPTLLLELTGTAGIILSLNCGHLLRNYSLFGNPLLDPAEADLYANGTHSLAALLSNLIKNVMLHTGTLLTPFNNFMCYCTDRIHDWLQFSPDDPRTTYPGFPFHCHFSSVSLSENDSGNILLMGCFVLGISIIIYRKPPTIVKSYLLCLLTGFVLFAFLLKWQPWGSRLQLPFFVLSAVPCAVAAYYLPHPEKWSRYLVLLLFIASLQWLLANKQRPLLGSGNVLFTPRMDQYFAGNEYSEAIRIIAASGIRKVGIKCGRDSMEYPLWQLARYNGTPITFRHQQVKNSSSLADLEAEEKLPMLLAIDQGHSWQPWGVYADYRKIYSTGNVELFAPKFPLQ